MLFFIVLMLIVCGWAVLVLAFKIIDRIIRHNDKPERMK